MKISCGVAKGGEGAAAPPPQKATSINFFVLYTFYIDDIIASCDIVDVTLVWTYQPTVKRMCQICEKASVLGVGVGVSKTKMDKYAARIVADKAWLFS